MFLAALDQTVVVHRAAHHRGGSARGVAPDLGGHRLPAGLDRVDARCGGSSGDQYGRKIFFQAAIVIFLIGSALSGLSHIDAPSSSLFRALQGLGGGGLMVGAQTIVGDVVSPRERGRYMGLFMAMFGVTTVIGPAHRRGLRRLPVAGAGSSTSTSRSAPSPWWSPRSRCPGR